MLKCPVTCLVDCLLIKIVYFDSETNRHTDEITREVCRSTKWMMLHVRDCPGTTASFDVCPFPWCRKVKHLLYHLVSCTEQEQCRICNGSALPRSMRRLHYLSAHRGREYRKALVEKSRKEAEKTEAADRISSNGGPSKSRIGGHANGSTPPSPVAGAAEDPDLVAAGGEEPTPIGTGHSHRDLNAMAGSSNSLAALAAAADVLAAEDFDADRDPPADETLVTAAVMNDPGDVSTPASGADLMATENSTLTNSCNPILEGTVSEAEVVTSSSAADSAIQDGMALPIEGADTTLESDLDATWEVEAEFVSSLSATDAAIQNVASVKMEDGDTSFLLDVDTKPASLVVSCKLEDEIGESNLPVTVADQPLEFHSQLESTTISTLTTTADPEEAENTILDSEPSVANVSSVVDSSQPESPTTRSETTRREPLRVQETIG